MGQSSGTGYIKRYSYDACAGQEPPPYFPTTGYFIPNRMFDVDPTNFDLDTYWENIVSGCRQ